MKTAETIIKPRRRIAALLTLLPWLPRSAFAGLPPVPPCSFSFDVTKRGNSVDEEFRVLEYRNYYFALKFEYSGQEDLWRVLKLVGDGSTYPDGRYAEPGVAVSVKLRVYRNSSDASPELIFEKSVKSEGAYVHGFSNKKFHGNYRRMIVPVGLRPGLYRVHVTTIEDAPEFEGTSTYLNIEFHPNVRSQKTK
jgi:hypothetical protein